jgi:hypothetical protein
VRSLVILEACALGRAEDADCAGIAVRQGIAIASIEAKAGAKAVTESDHRVRAYLRAFAPPALKYADRPWLWPLFLLLLAMVPGTMRELVEQRGEAHRGVRRLTDVNVGLNRSE